MAHLTGDDLKAAHALLDSELFDVDPQLAVAKMRAELREELLAGLVSGPVTEQYAIELHYLPGEDGWRLWTDAGWPRQREGHEGNPFPYADRAEAERSLEYIRRGYGNGGRDWARLVRRTVGPWEQVEG